MIYQCIRDTTETKCEVLGYTDDCDYLFNMYVFDQINLIHEPHLNLHLDLQFTACGYLDKRKLKKARNKRTKFFYVFQ